MKSAGASKTANPQTATPGREEGGEGVVIKRPQMLPSPMEETCCLLTVPRLHAIPAARCPSRAGKDPG